MDLRYSAAEERFRIELRQWLQRHADQFPSRASGIPYHWNHELIALHREWQQKLFEGGWSGIHWPEAYGGRGASLMEQAIFCEEMVRIDAPDLTGMFFVAQQHAGPTIMVHGTEAQKKKHLPGILNGSELWCQGFSEPNAGSDLANIQTRAELKGDHFIINGQKIWSSYATFADYCEMMVRTDPTAPKHKGISFLIIDMKTPGIEIRPIKQITGHHEFCEVFFEDVKVPVENLVGKLHDGWRVSMTTLGFERGIAFFAKQLSFVQWIKQLIQTVQADAEQGGGTGAGLELLDDLLSLYCDTKALIALSYRDISISQANKTPGPQGSIVKLHWTELERRMSRVAIKLQGWRSVCLGDDALLDGLWQYRFFRSFSRTIAAGTSEIQRNIIGERILGLPR